MIVLDNVTRLQRSEDSILMLLTDCSHYFGRDERVGILAIPGTGKSAIARMLAGIEKPDSGQIYREGKTSWPIGFAGGFHPELTAQENITFLAALAGQDAAACIAFCVEFANLGGSMGKKVKTFSSVERLEMAYSFSLSISCDMYIADEVIGIGDKEMRIRCKAMLDQRLENAGLIFLSKNPSQLKAHCTRFLVLVDSKLVPCDDLDVGVEALSMARDRSSSQPLAMHLNQDHP